MADYDSFQYGGITFPLTVSTANPLLKDADPALYYALAYFQSVLTTHMGARLLAQCATGPVVVDIKAAVAQVCPYNPDPYLTETQFKYPLLAIYRNKAEDEDVTVTWPHEVQEWTVQYILPPLNSGQMERISPILSVIPKILQNRIENKFDPAFLSGADVWALAGVEAVKLVGGVWSRYEAAGNLVFPCWTGRMVVKERVMPLPQTFSPPEGFQALTGIDNEEDLVDNINPDLTNVVDTKIDF